MRLRLLALATLLAVASCQGGADSAGPTPTPTPSPTPSPSPRSVVTAVATPSPRASSSPYHWSLRRVTAADLPHSWHSGCPVGPSQLRLLTLPYVGFDGLQHTGRLVVQARVVDGVVHAFRSLYQQRFPIRSLRVVDDFGGSDDASMAADNSSGFNCRQAVGGSGWSQHAYGLAVDVNPRENPYLYGRHVLPPEGAAYVDRTPYRPGMAVRGGVLVRAFAAVGWGWGGQWRSSKDYQHFSPRAILTAAATATQMPRSPAPTRPPSCPGVPDVGAANQVVLVVASGTTASVRACERRRGGWVSVLGAAYGHVGVHGVAPSGAKREGDGRTPSGVFALGRGFGVRADPGVRFGWRRTTSSDVWVDDPGSALYDTWQQAPANGRWRSAEPLHVPGTYDYVQVIDYNTRHVPGAGSAIFLHVDHASPTSGCVAVPRARLLALLRWERPGAVIAIR